MSLVAVAAAIGAVRSEARAADAERTFVIVHTKELLPAAKEWAAYRSTQQGGAWKTLLHAVNTDESAEAARTRIREFIRQTYSNVAPKGHDQFAVLLLGDIESSAQDSATGIPTWYFSQHDSVMRSRDGSNDSFSTDHPYQTLEGDDEKPRFMLGRVPARHVEEALGLLEKIKRYESPASIEALANPSRVRIAYTAGEGRFGVMDDVLEMLFKMMVDRMVPDAFDLSMIYAKASSVYCPPPSKLTESVWNQLDEGALLFNYIGHGFAQGFDSLHWRNQRLPILNTWDVARLSQQEKASPSSRDGLLPIAFFSCCSSGWFDLPGGDRSMAEELLFNRRGAIAVVAGSRITHPYANTLMQMNITKALLVDRAPLVGLLDLQATQNLLNARTPMDRQLDAIASPIARSGKWESTLAEYRSMHVRLYNLLGDPATRIALPVGRVTKLAYKDGSVTGIAADIKIGKAKVFIETSRTTMTQPDRVQMPTGHDDPDLEAKAAANVGLVNDRVLLRTEAEIVNGEFAAPLILPPNTAVVRVYAVGENEAGIAIDAVGAIRVQPIQN